MQAFRGLFCLIMSTVQFLNDKCLWICSVELHLSLVIGSRSPSARMCLVNLFAGCHFVSKDIHSSLGDPSLKPFVEPASCSFLRLILQLSLRREWKGGEDPCTYTYMYACAAMRKMRGSRRHLPNKAAWPCSGEEMPRQQILPATGTLL